MIYIPTSPAEAVTELIEPLDKIINKRIPIILLSSTGLRAVKICSNPPEKYWKCLQVIERLIQSGSLRVYEDFEEEFLVNYQEPSIVLISPTIIQQSGFGSHIAQKFCKADDKGTLHPISL